MALDVLGFPLIELGEFIARSAMHPQQLVKLRLEGLIVAVYHALENQRHEPGGQRGNSVPVQRVALKEKPEDRINGDDPERRRVRGQQGKSREPAPDWM